MKRPPLDKNISLKDFEDFYWLKAELREFCKNIGINSSGGKLEISKRISLYLKTGIVEKKSSITKKRIQQPCHVSFALDAIIGSSFKCSRELRSFFESIVGSQFHFSVTFQKWCKENPGKTYADAVNAWREEEEKKRSGNYITTISSQFKYNQFMRDFFSDPVNKGKKLSDAIAAWELVKRQPGDNKYRSHEPISNKS
jgi:hypothetical protein